MERMNVNTLSAWIAPAILVILCAACGAENPAGISYLEEIAPLAAVVVSTDATASGISVSLEQIAEIERAGVFFPGLGFAEAEFREDAGDYAGAAVAAYKELAWAYSYGIVSSGQVEEGLQGALAYFENISAEPNSPRSAGARAIRGCIAFARGNWEEAEELLLGIISPDEDPDSYLRWMLLVCILEQNKGGDEGRAARSAYGAIRARHRPFPEYWYRGARNIGAVYAEPCINLNPQGPFAEDCRTILAEHFGIPHGGKSIRTQVEIETILRASVSANNPRILEELFPLMALPDNPYTIYALGALQALNSIPEYRAFFAGEALKASGRLAERLNYISRG